MPNLAELSINDDDAAITLLDFDSGFDAAPQVRTPDVLSWRGAFLVDSLDTCRRELCVMYTSYCISNCFVWVAVSAK